MRTAMVGHLDFPIPEVCPAWNVCELPPRDRTLVRSRVPVLFMSGTLDGRTPPRNAEEIRKGFPNSSHVLIEGARHGNDLFISSPEIQKVMLEFIKTGTVSSNHIALPPCDFDKSYVLRQWFANRSAGIARDVCGSGSDSRNQRRNGHQSAPRERSVPPERDH